MPKMLLCTLFVWAIFTHSTSSRSFHSSYNDALTAYSGSSFATCAGILNEAITTFRETDQTLLSCYIRCSRRRSTSVSDTFRSTDTSIFSKSKCLTRCLQEIGVGPTSQSYSNFVSTSQSFRDLEPYRYLFKCLNGSGQLEAALSAALTYSLRNQDSEVNEFLSIHRSKAEFANSLKNLEEQPFHNFYLTGVQYYNNEDWSNALDRMEHASKEYFVSYEKCLASCEVYDLFTEGESNVPTVKALASLYNGLLECQRTCPEKVSAGYLEGDVLPLIYHYLQFSYFKLNRMPDAASATETYLALKPNDRVLQQNKLFYAAQDGVTPQCFTIRPEVEAFLNQMKQIKSLLGEAAGFYHPDPNESGSYEGFTYDMDRSDYIVARDNFENLDDLKQTKGIIVVQTEAGLRGPDRFMAANVASQAECNFLVELSEYAQQGDGYAGQEKKSSPHTDNEYFRGLSVRGALNLVDQGIITSRHLHTYVQISERVRDLMEKYFALPTTLYFAFTHMACRTAVNDNAQRSDLSHPIHSDNCHIREDNSCPRVRPAYIERDYTALLYLNSDFEGGEFFFTYRNKTIQSEVKPTLGQLVGFHSSNYHGVKAVTGGTRCALAIWFTLDAAYREKDHDVAWAKLADTGTFGRDDFGAGGGAQKSDTFEKIQGPPKDEL